MIKTEKRIEEILQELKIVPPEEIRVLLQYFYIRGGEDIAKQIKEKAIDIFTK